MILKNEKLTIIKIKIQKLYNWFFFNKSNIKIKIKIKIINQINKNIRVMQFSMSYLNL
jgi:hypothetical protein